MSKNKHNDDRGEVFIPPAPLKDPDMTLGDKMMDRLAILREVRRMPLPKRIVSWENTITEITVETITGIFAGAVFGFGAACSQVIRRAHQPKLRSLRRVLLALARQPEHFRENTAKYALMAGTLAATFATVDAGCRHYRGSADPINRGIAGFLTALPRAGILISIGAGATAYMVDDALERANIRLFQLPGEVPREDIKEIIQTGHAQVEQQIAEEIARRKIERQERILAGLPVEPVIDHPRHPHLDAWGERFEWIWYKLTDKTRLPYISRKARRELAAQLALEDEKAYVRALYSQELQRERNAGSESVEEPRVVLQRRVEREKSSETLSKPKSE